MAITNGTYLTDLINPQVMADMISKKLVNAMMFSPLAQVDDTLVGRPGDTVTLPSFAYIGDATTVAEGENIPISKLTATPTTATIHKIGKGVQITDEAVLSGFGKPVDEATKQIILSLASQLDNEMLGVLRAITGTMLYETATAGAALAPDDINEALLKFGEDVDGQKVIVVSPALLKVLRKADWLPASEIAADMRIRGTVGESYGCQVFVSNKLTAAGDAYIVKPGALRIFLKRDTLVEADRDIINKSTIITADKHEVCYLYDASKAIKLAPKA